MMDTKLTPLLAGSLKLGDRVRAENFDLGEKNPTVVGEIMHIHPGTGFTLLQDNGKSVYVDNRLRTYYLLEREEEQVVMDASDSIEVDVNGHTFQLGEGQHFRVWLEDGRTHVEMVLP